MRRLTYQLATECSGPLGEPTPFLASLCRKLLCGPLHSHASPLLLLLVSAPSASALILKASTKATFGCQLPLLPSEVQNPALQCSKAERSSESPL